MKSWVDGDRSRYGWWALVLALAAVVTFVAYRFVGTLVFGLFLYYAVRPANRRIREYVDSSSLAAGLTMLLILVPLLAILGYVLFLGLRELSAFLANESVRGFVTRYVDLGALTRNPDPQLLAQFAERLRQPGPIQEAISTTVGVLGAATNALIHVSIIIAIVFYLLRDDYRVRNWYRDLVGRDSAAYAYGLAVDADLRSVYFGNVITVAMITGLSIVWYNVYNVFAPQAVSLPTPTLLALLTGIASMVPLVVGKVVYVPATAYIALGAYRTDPGLVWYPVAFVVVAFVFLDFVPQTFIQPYIAGRNMHVGLMLFAYIFGGLVFGWYGLFLGPLVLVLALQAVRIAVTPLLRGLPVTQTPTAAADLGSDPALEE